jgi:HEAT repeat protein
VSLVALFCCSSQGQTAHPKASLKTASARLERSAWEVLDKNFKEGKSAEKIDVIIALGTIGREPAAVAMAEQGLKDDDSDVRLAAVSTLSQMKSRSSIPKLRRALKDREPEVSFAAAQALWSMGDRSARQLFIAVLQGERATSPGMIEAAKKHYLNVKTLAWTGVQEGAGAVFGPLGFGVTAVRELMKDKGAPARALSAEKLSLDHSPEALRALEDAANDDNWAVRSAVADALGNTGNRAALPALRSLLDDDKEAVRCMAAAAIIRLETHQPPRLNIADLPFPQQRH